MQHKLSSAERKVQCLYHLTRHKLESHQEAAYGQSKRRGGVSSPTPAGTDVVGTVCDLNEGIHRTCVLLVEGLELLRTYSTRYRRRSTTVLGDHLRLSLKCS